VEDMLDEILDNPLSLAVSAGLGLGAGCLATLMKTLPADKTEYIDKGPNPQSGWYSDERVYEMHSYHDTKQYLKGILFGAAVEMPALLGTLLIASLTNFVAPSQVASFTAGYYAPHILGLLRKHNPKETK
jgi:hypothetical protein